MALTYVGKSIPRVDGVEKVTGAAPYVALMEVPGAVVGRALRSPLPHARVVHIDARRAEKVPGVVCVLTRDDVLSWGISPYFGTLIRDQPIVAIDRVRYVGDIVAAVAAETEEAAAEALELIQVEYEELPAVLDIEEALAPDAPLLHPQLAGSDVGTGDTAGVQVLGGTNICGYFRIRKGDVQQGFKESDYVFEEEYRVPPISHAALEPHACIAQVFPDGSIEVWSSTQTPSSLRRELAETFRVPFSKVRVRVAYVGGGFGGKCYSKIEPLAVALARKARRPVKLVLTREECFLTTTRHGARVRVKTGVKTDGTLVARQLEIVYDGGAYADVSPRVARNGAYPGPGPYRIPHVWVDAYAVYTNKPPAGAFRGYGVSQVCWAVESHMDQIARALGMDPLEFRLKNALREGDLSHTGQVVRGMPVAEVLKAAAEAVGWDRVRDLPPPPPGRYRGRGIAVSIKGSSPSVSHAVLKMNEDGSLDVLVSTVEIGQGSETVLSQMAAEALALPLEQVRIVQPDTAVTPYDRSTSSSRSVFMMGKAILAAAEEIRQQLLEAAADLLEVSPADLELRDGAAVVRGSPDRCLTYAEVIRRRFGARVGNLLGRGLSETRGELREEDGQGNITPFWETAATACVVEVDAETGQITLLDYACAADVGRAINPVLCSGQVEGGAMQGIGAALYEEMKFEGGQPLNPHFLDYSLPTLWEMPRRFRAILLEHPHQEGPYGAHGVGEAAIMSAAPAIANAVCDALGVRIKELPITPEKILQALREREPEALRTSAGKG